MKFFHFINFDGRRKTDITGWIHPNLQSNEKRQRSRCFWRFHRMSKIVRQTGRWNYALWWITTYSIDFGWVFYSVLHNLMLNNIIVILQKYWNIIRWKIDRRSTWWSNEWMFRSRRWRRFHTICPWVQLENILHPFTIIYQSISSCRWRIPFIL